MTTARSCVRAGQMDTLLSERGQKQAEFVGAHLKDRPLRAIYSSDLKRAKHVR
jgi:broad specificity phosphatase PhoE